MVLIMGRDSSLRQALTEMREAKAIEPDHDDAFGAAIGHRAVVYVAPAEGAIDEIDNALRAARAPGVEVIVALLPLEGGEPVVKRLAKDGKPYVVLRAPPLLEDVGASLGARRFLFVDRRATLRAVEGKALARAVSEAIETDKQGRVVELGEVPLPLSDALERAAELTNRRISVFALWTPLARAAQWLERLFRRPALLPTGRTLSLAEAGNA